MYGICVFLDSKSLSFDFIMCSIFFSLVDRVDKLSRMFFNLFVLIYAVCDYEIFCRYIHHDVAMLKAICAVSNCIFSVWEIKPKFVCMINYEKYMCNI